MSKSYSIGEVATMTKLSIPTIRYYDKEGLIPELKKDASGARCFDDQNLGALEMIECLKTAGMSIKDIKTFMQWNLEGDTTLKKRRDFLTSYTSRCSPKWLTYNEPSIKSSTSKVTIAKPWLMVRRSMSRPALDIRKL